MRPGPKNFTAKKLAMVAGLCARFDELIAQGMSQRQAARQIEKDQKGKWGTVLYKANTLRRRYYKVVPGKTIPIRDERGKFAKGLEQVTSLVKPSISHHARHRFSGADGGKGGRWHRVVRLSS